MIPSAYSRFCGRQRPELCPLDGRITRQARHCLVALACRAQHTVSRRCRQEWRHGTQECVRHVGAACASESRPMSDQAPKILTPPYYERLSELEDKHPWTQAMRRMGLELAAHYAGPVPTRVLDAGCGTGRFLHECGGRWAQAQLFGCDLSADGLHFATRRGLKRLAVANVTTLPFASSAFDVVVCADVLQHLSAANANQALGQFARLLRRSGTLIIRTAARRGIGRKKHRDSGDYQQWETEKLRAALESRGFDVVFLSRVNWLPSMWADLKGLFKPAPKGDAGLSLEPPPANHWKSRLMTSYWRQERHLILARGWRPPGGHTLFCAARKAGRD